MKRRCDTCGVEIISGYVIEDGLEYYCSDDCLHAVYSEKEYDELCQENCAYWTEWDDDDDLL